MTDNFKITLIDYGMGNVKSIKNALDHIGDFEVDVTADHESIRRSDCIILPGVGAFSDAMKNLRDRGLVELLSEVVLDDKKPILGICLGMQLLFSSSQEGGVESGLNWIPGAVKYMKPGDGFRVPHVGWNNLQLRRPSPMFSSLGEDKDFYFVHSYHADCPSEFVIASFDYGQEYTAAVQKGNVVGMQFHPEKSQKNGLAALRSFIEWAGGTVNA